MSAENEHIITLWFEYILYQIIEKTSIAKLLLQIIQISPQVQCNKHACRHLHQQTHRVSKNNIRYPERCIGRGGRYLRSASIHSHLRPRNNAWSALPNKARMQSLPGLPLVPLPWVNFPTECQEGAPSVTDNYPNGQSCYQYTHS